MEKLPQELVQEIIKRGDLSELQGLCNTNKNFRRGCNYISKRLLEKTYIDFYQIYVTLQQFHICITPFDGNSVFIKTNKMEKIPENFNKLLNQIYLQKSNYDSSWNIDNKSPKQISLKFINYDDYTYNFNVTIQGDLKSYYHCEKLANELTNVFENYISYTF